MEHSRLKSVVESLLFVSENAVTLDRMSAVLEGVEKKEILSVIEELRSEYESQGRGIFLFEVAGGFQMRTPKENADWVKNLLRGKAARMSRARSCLSNLGLSNPRNPGNNRRQLADPPAKRCHRSRNP